MEKQVKEEEGKEFTVLYARVNIVITIDPKTNILDCRWIGLQSEEALRFAGQRIYGALVQYSCSRVLNDSTRTVASFGALGGE